VIAPSLSFPPTGSWDTWGTAEVTTDLVAGFNTIRLTTTGSSGGNFDALVIGP
jgi:hypothetical protein